MEYIDDYKSCKRTYATLLIYPKGISVDDITRRLKLIPTRISLANDLPRKQVNGWYYSTKDQVFSRDSRSHIDFLLDIFEPLTSEICQLRLEGVVIEMCCFWESTSGNGGPTLSPQQMKRLGKLDLELWWDIWFDE